MKCITELSLVIQAIYLSNALRSTSRLNHVEHVVKFDDSRLSQRVSKEAQLLNLASSDEWAQEEGNLLRSSNNRFALSGSVASAVSYLRSRMESLGMRVQEQEFTMTVPEGVPDALLLARRFPQHKALNLIGTWHQSSASHARKGTLLLCAHYDSLPIEGQSLGADDNGSGVATVLQVAENLRSQASSFPFDVQFVLFSGEELGLQGSSAFVRDILPQLSAPARAIVFDQVGAGSGIILETVGDNAENNALIDSIALFMRPTSVNYDGFGSDHIPFLKAGVPSVLVIEDNNMANAREFGHTSRDDLSHIRFEFGNQVASAVSQAVVQMAYGSAN